MKSNDSFHKTCLCGCGKEFLPKRSNQKYILPSHQARDAVARFWKRTHRNYHAPESRKLIKVLVLSRCSECKEPCLLRNKREKYCDKCREIVRKCGSQSH